MFKFLKRITELEEQLNTVNKQLSDVNKFNKAALDDFKTIRSKLVELENRLIKLEHFNDSIDFEEIESNLKKDISNEVRSYLLQISKELYGKVDNLSKLFQKRNSVPK